ncbi:MAG: hypothetical protein P8R42_19130 [Candidatus Binatia bacterium]|nr:hypothetical protein [Candidatus Binatia bacterium]
MLARTTALLSVAVLFFTASFPAYAQETPDELTSNEWRCERQTARSTVDAAAGTTDCILECEQAAKTNPLRNCQGPFGFDTTTQLCLSRAQAQPEIRMLRKCAAEDCPECYNGGDCSSFRNFSLFQGVSHSSERMRLIACDDTASPDGLNPKEERCRHQLAQAADRLQVQLRRCFDDCQGRRRRGTATEESCRTDALLTGDADDKLERCAYKARVRFLRSCLDCDDEPECFSPQFPRGSCPDLLALVEDQAQEDEEALFCVDQPRCGDGFVSGTEQCDFLSFPHSCGQNEECNSSCECEAFPVCGDGLISGFEFCDASATPTGCPAGDACVNCDGCAPDVCGSATTVGPNGGRFFGSTSGQNSTTGFCGGNGPEDAYRWTPDRSGLALMDTCGSNFDTVLHVRQDRCDQFGPHRACNDDACGLSSQVAFNVQAGTTYYVFVDAFNSDGGGSYTLLIDPPGDIYGSPQRAFLQSTACLLD